MTPSTNLKEVVRLAAVLGVTAFGGPAAHIAMLRDQVVDQRKWMSSQHFLDLVGATNLIPGPNSTEMVMHVGFERAGRRGLLGAGIAFILPAACITLLFAVAYERYGTTPNGENLLYGIKAVILAVVLQAIARLGKTAVQNPVDVVAIAAIALLFVAGVSEILLLFLGGISIAAARRGLVWFQTDRNRLASVVLLPLGLQQDVAVESVPYSLGRLFLQFLKIGGLLYGSGYVLLAFLHSTFVDDYGWITDQQLIDAVAVGQVTPGPVFTTATFVGYLVGGFAGAVAATIAIFLPAFVFVAILNPYVSRIRDKPLLSYLLDGINLAAIGLMVGVAWYLARDAIVDVPTAVIGGAALLLLLWRNANSALLVVAGGALGLLIKLI